MPVYKVSTPLSTERDMGTYRGKGLKMNGMLVEVVAVVGQHPQLVRCATTS